MVETDKITVSACQDPDLNMFLERAIAGNGKVIVSSDNHLLKISGYQGIAVVKPTDFTDNVLCN
jgi:predicted nucleic acid-binding protein